MWQCLRELRSRKSFIEQYLTEIEETNDRIELLHIEKERGELTIQVCRDSVDPDWGVLQTNYERSHGQLTEKELVIKNRQLDRKIKGLEDHKKAIATKVEDYAEEARFFLKEFNSLQTLEPLKPLDDLDAQKEYWTAKLFNEINIRMLLRQPLDIETIKMTLTLNDDSPLKQQVIKMLEGNNKSIEGKDQPKNVKKTRLRRV